MDQASVAARLYHLRNQVADVQNRLAAETSSEELSLQAVLGELDACLDQLREEDAHRQGLLASGREPSSEEPTHAESEIALRTQEAYFRALIEHSSDIIVVLNADGSLRYASPSQTHILGYTPEDRIDHMTFELIHPDDLPTARHILQHLVENATATISAEVRVRHKDGTWRYLEVAGRNLVADPAVQGIVFNAHDITQRRRAQERLVRDAFHDPLTGLANRSLFIDRLGHLVARGKRHPQMLFALLFLDLDRFKTINDSLGHQAGDTLLVQVARRLEGCLRPTDSLARLSGDEFAILLEDLSDEQAGIDVATRIGRELTQPFVVDNHEVFTNASVGITLSTIGYTSPEEMLRDADAAMYRAKALGKGGYAIFDQSMHARALAQLRLEADLQRAIARDEFVLHYQPIVSLSDGKIKGLEALVRWQHPRRGLVSPLDFIPLAEETGLIVPLGEWVLHTACTQLQAWHASGKTQLCVSVNLSARQFRDAGLGNTIARALSATALRPDSLELEMTESLLMDDAASSLAALEQFKVLGVKVLAIDDFGTGYSSLSYLRRLPITAVKIDRSFVRDIASNSGDASLIAGIIALSHSLGLTVVAEGVETQAQFDLLRSYGCDCIQGYFFSRPLAAADLTMLLQDQ